MARPKCCRRINGTPACRLFRPADVTVSDLEEVVLSMDELEAIRLADLEGLYQEHAAESMNVSRQTFGRIVQNARRKVAQVLVQGAALRIEGGDVEMSSMPTFVCDRCRKRWTESCANAEPGECPKCRSDAIRRQEEAAGRPESAECCRRKPCRSDGS